MRQLQWFLAASLLLSLSACERQAAEDETPKETAANQTAAETSASTSAQTTTEKKLEAEEEKPDDASKPKALMNLDVNPYTEEFSSFEISWKGDKAEVDLLGKPEAGAAKATTIALEKGDVLKWKSYKYHVLTPVTYTASAKVEYKGYSPVDEKTLALEDGVDRTFEKDEKIYYYAYAGEGTCYTGWQGDGGFVYALGGCPTDDKAWTLTGAKKPEAQWFIEVEGKDKKTGWLLVDDRFDSKATSILEGE